MKRILTTICAFVLAGTMALTASAQGNYAVKGVVVDELGPVFGASIIEQGTTNGTATDHDGNYTLMVASGNSILEISCLGYATLVFRASEVPATIVLNEDTQFLNEVIVIGYGTLSKKELSSSIVQVDKKDFVKGSMNNVMEMLSGKVAGLNINTTAAANPNSSSSVQVRGATSLSAGNDPLYVIDGVPGGSIRNVSPQDIESITVLKDAASAAIYGTRGANGVILITTKKGSEAGGAGAQVTYDSWFGVNLAKPYPAILTPDEFRRSRRGADYGYSTEWYKLIMRDFSYDLNQYISIDGGTDASSYNASVNYKRATGMDIAAAREEFGGRTAVEQKLLGNRLSVGMSINARQVNETWGSNGMFDTALTLNPTMPVKNPDGSWYQPTTATGIRNPYSELVANTSNGQRSYLLGTAFAKLNLFQNDSHSIGTTLTYTYTYNDLKSNYYSPSTSSESFWSEYKGRASLTYNKNWGSLFEWLLNYTFSRDGHSLSAVAGYSWQDENRESMNAENMDFAYDTILYHSIGSGSYLKEGKAGMYSGKSLSKLIGVFGRVNYNWNNFIFASASLRYEGSTKFGKDNKWGYFPAASVAAELKNTDLLAGVDAVQSLKPRASFGITGRSGFGAYTALATYSANGTYLMDGEWVQGYAPSSNANPGLAWEKLLSVNLGVDFSFFGRLRGSIDLYDRQSLDLLYNYTAPQPPFVYSSILVNVGTTDNRGVELSLDYDVVKGLDFGWTTGINASWGITKLKKLSDEIYKSSYIELYRKPGVGTNEYFFRIAEGSKVGQFYGYEYAGVDENGNMLVLDNDGEKQYASGADPAWKRYIGNGTPSAFLTWSNSFRYRNWDLGFMWRGAFGFEIFNMRKYGMGLQSCGTDNVLRDAYGADAFLKSGGGVISSYFLEKGDYFKLDNATLGYNLAPRSRNGIIKNLRAYLSAKNLVTLTKYSGNDPSIVPVNGIEPGVDVSTAYPLATTVTLGATITF